MTILVLVEHDNQELKQATLNAVTAAQSLSSDIVLLVAGSEDSDNVAASAAQIAGVTKVLHATSSAYKHFLAENMAELIVEIAKDGNYKYIVAPATTFGKNILPRVAALLDVAQISAITKIISDDTFERPIYAGNAIATVQSSDSIKVITVRPTAFAVAELSEAKATIEKITQQTDLELSEFIDLEETKTERPELTTAKVVVSGGRGLQDRENFKMLETLADKLNAAIGASRAAVDAGFVPNDYQVGQTGKVVAPELYIAVGISGAIQHVAGIKDSKVIVAINKDEDAPIFQVANYGLVGDLFKIIPELIEAL